MIIITALILVLSSANVALADDIYPFSPRHKDSPSYSNYDSEEAGRCAIESILEVTHELVGLKRDSWKKGAAGGSSSSEVDSEKGMYFCLACKDEKIKIIDDAYPCPCSSWGPTYCFYKKGKPQSAACITAPYIDKISGKWVPRAISSEIVTITKKGYTREMWSFGTTGCQLQSHVIFDEAGKRSEAGVNRKKCMELFAKNRSCNYVETSKMDKIFLDEKIYKETFGEGYKFTNETRDQLLYDKDRVLYLEKLFKLMDQYDKSPSSQIKDQIKKQKGYIRAMLNYTFRGFEESRCKAGKSQWNNRQPDNSLLKSAREIELFNQCKKMDGYNCEEQCQRVRDFVNSNDYSYKIQDSSSVDCVHCN